MLNYHINVYNCHIIAFLYTATRGIRTTGLVQLDATILHQIETDTLVSAWSCIEFAVRVTQLTHFVTNSHSDLSRSRVCSTTTSNEVSTPDKNMLQIMSITLVFRVIELQSTNVINNHVRNKVVTKL